MNFCSRCGSRLTYRTPPGDDRDRYVCAACGAIHYQNPRVVVGCIVEQGDRVLLCRRAIDPSYGKWTLPAGYLENGETVESGAERETREEAGVRIEALEPYRLFNIVHINQIYLMFRARLADAQIQPGKESLEAGLFTEAGIPWDTIAFRVISETLRDFFKDRSAGSFPFTINDILPVATPRTDPNP
jgi:ADP-ribose pyrophosphatase YjhB (NUDIX family)